MKRGAMVLVKEAGQVRLAAAVFSRGELMSSFSRRLVSGCLRLIVLLIYSVPSLSFAAPVRLDVPVANLEIEHSVPLPLARRIALLKSKETWGDGVLGNPIPLSDLNGNVVVYMFPFQIGGKTFPAHDEVLRGIKEGRELQSLVHNSQMDKAKEMYRKMDRGKAAVRDTAVTAGPEIPQETVRPDGSLSRRKELQEISRFASRKAIGAGEFGTIFVAATYDQFPVPAYFHYLAPYFTNFDLALEKSAQVIGPEGILKRIYFMGLEGQYFEFVSNSGSTLINSKTLENHPLEKLKQTGETPLQSLADAPGVSPKKMKRDNEIFQEWEKIKAAIGGE
jgi:hypothetical protein